MTGETPWTAGPWDWSGTPQYEGGGFHCYLLDATGRKIGALWGPNKEKIANAHLIAAAPELYVAAKLGLTSLQSERQQIVESHCIRRADGPDLSTLDPDVAEDVKALDFDIATVRAAIAKARGDQP